MRNTIIAVSLAVLAIVHVLDFADRHMPRHDGFAQQAYDDGYSDGYTDGAASMEENPFQ